jgi:excisionase family DNA binding protein
MDNFVLTSEAAEVLGVSRRRVQALITSGQLPAQKVGRDWLIARADLETFAQQPRPVGYPKGRPRTTEGEDASQDDAERGKCGAA